jgi:hypothetical protein
MSALSIRLPESLHRNARAHAGREGASVNRMVNHQSDPKAEIQYAMTMI